MTRLPADAGVGPPRRAAHSGHFERDPNMTAFTLPLILALSAANPAPATPAHVPSKGAQTMTQSRKLETATLAGGCFWCLDAVFEELKGVDKVVSGFSGGTAVNPSYE